MFRKFFSVSSEYNVYVNKFFEIVPSLFLVTIKLQNKTSPSLSLLTNKHKVKQFAMTSH